MTFILRCLILPAILALLSATAQAQLGLDLLQSQRNSGTLGGQQQGLTQGQGGALGQGGSITPSLSTGGGLVSPSISNGGLQRQMRNGRQGDPSQQFDSRGQPLKPEPQPQPQAPERIEFQDFVAQSTGRDLPIFGSELFQNAPSTFAALDNVPVSSDYVIGPGDEILIRAWGQLDVDYTAVVDRTGTINIPKVGTINVAGTKYADLTAHLKNAIGRVYRNFDLSVSLGQLRAIQVYVVGQARKPGSYTVGSMSTLVNAIFAAGGPSAKGSMRRIQLKRGNRVVTELDLYELLIGGDKSRDTALLPGDVIHIPPVGSLVAISGSVNVPAIFELKSDGTLAEALGWAGGLASTASGQKATVERVDTQKGRKSVDEFNLDTAGRQTNLRNGDIVTIYSIAPRIENAVTLRGNVAQPARVPWRAGMRVKDLIPETSALISRNYWQRRNQAVGIDNTISGLLRRSQAAGLDLSTADLLKKYPQNQEDQPDMTVAETIRKAQIANDIATVTAKPSSTTSTPSGPRGLGAGQGSQAAPQTPKSPARATDEIRRNLNEVNWNYAVIERINPRDLTTSLVPFNLGRAILEDDPTQNLLLQPGDTVTIFSVDDITLPAAKQTKYVRLEGEFANAGVYAVQPGETLRQLVARVGGLSPNAYLFGAEFTRESNRVYQQKKLEEMINRLEREIQAISINRSRNVTTAEEAAGLSTDAQAQTALITKLRQVQATGRIVLELPPDESTALKDLPDIVLEDSDHFTVPSKPSTVNVLGAVYNENAFIYKPEKRLTDYLRQAGGVSRTGDKSDVYLLRVDGSVLSKRQSGWLSSGFEGERLLPGDTIVVPEDVDRTTWTRVLKDWGQILYQMGLGVAALKVIRD